MPLLRGGTNMPNYQAAPSGHAISRRIADLLEDIDPIQYSGSSRARRVRNINDHIQGRNDMPLGPLLDWAAQVDGGGYAGRVTEIHQMIQTLQAQKSLMDQPYPLPYTLESPYQKYTDDPLNPIKIIDQPLFDQTAKAGFPCDFFRCSYFEGVNIYCMPDGADCTSSTFYHCNFTACRIRRTMFPQVTMQDCGFDSCALQEVIFHAASISNTHFTDSTLRSVTFQEARLKSCLTVDCTLEGVDFFHTRLDGCTYGRIQAADIMNLPYAQITQGGATEVECARNRAGIFRALGVEDPERIAMRRRAPGSGR